MKNVSFSFYLIFALLLTACQDKQEALDGYDYQPERLQELMPLEPGKYITYKLDSTVFTQFGRNTEIHSYQEKHLVDAKIVDNLGRDTYRIIRTLRDAEGKQPWSAAGTYFVTRIDNKVEVVEDNQRVVKLITPLKEGTKWKGNQYLPNEPYSGLYSFSHNNSMHLWEYTYTKVNTDTAFNGFTFNGVTTVDHVSNFILPDTIQVSANNEASIPANVATAWVRGSATGQVTINAARPTSSGSQYMTVYNKSNRLAVLNGIDIPVDKGRNFQFINNEWTLGSNPSLISELPFASVEFSTEKYAKQVGLIYQNKILWENQPNIGGSSPYKVGFGVERTLIDHN